MTARQTPDAVREGMFADWSTKTLADQCHMQAREQLDPEFTQFMTAVGILAVHGKTSPYDTPALVRDRIAELFHAERVKEAA